MEIRVILRNLLPKNTRLAESSQSGAGGNVGFCSENVDSWNKYLLFANCVTSGKTVRSSVPQLPYRSNANGNLSYAVELFVGFHEMTHEKLPAQELARREGYIITWRHQYMSKESNYI